MKNAIILLTAVLAMVACDDVFEVDLRDKTVDIVAPTDGATSKEGEVTFAWSELHGARSYHLRIVEGTFGQASGLIADTVMHNDSTAVKLSFKAVLDAGNYQWSISAANGAYSSDTRIMALFVVGPDEPDEPGEDR